MSPKQMAALSRAGVLLVLCIGLSIATPHFLDWNNLINLLRSMALLYLTALGMTLCMISGGIDLSVGAVAALATVVGASFIEQDQVAIGILVTLVVGLATGLANGALIAWLRIPPFVATYGMMQIARGAAVAFTGGYSIYGFTNKFFLWLGKGFAGPIPAPVVTWLVVMVITAALLSRTTFGRSLYATGANRDSAWFSGIPVERITFLTYGISGLLSALVGLLIISRIGAADATLGDLWPLDAVGAAVIGGTSFTGGQGSATGTALGALILAVLSNGLNLLNVSSYWQVFSSGLVIVLAVLLDTVIRLRFSKGRVTA